LTETSQMFAADRRTTTFAVG